MVQSPCPYDTVHTGEWTPFGKAQVLYMRPSDVTFAKLLHVIDATKPAVIYLNSFLDPVFTQRILWARRLGFFRDIPIILAPRGELSSGALALKHRRKRLYIGLSRAARLHSRVAWQASSEHEKSDILRALPWVSPESVRIAMDLASAEAPHAVCAHERPPGAPLRVCFLSRISPMKNLDFAITAMAQVQTPVDFTIYGPQSTPTYWALRESLIAELPAHVSVTYGGVVIPGKQGQAPTAAQPEGPGSCTVSSVNHR
jgi:glycosyltransferase involved in cell wall biosynthesis